jgi:hypothetical protein
MERRRLGNRMLSLGFGRSAPALTVPRKASGCALSARTGNRHRWVSVNALRRARETSLRNSANWPRNFGRRGAPASVARRALRAAVNGA